MTSGESKIAVLLTNLGTPESPTVSSTKKYLREFLSDKHVVNLPKIIWSPILYTVVLPFRSPQSTRLYQKIWTKEGSPLRVNLEKQTQKLNAYFENANLKIKIFSAMRYGEPSLISAIKKISAEKFNQLILFPLYPQYSHTTTTSTIKKVEECLKTIENPPALKIIKQYYDNPDYISAIAGSVNDALQQFNPDKILFSFHGLPEKNIKKNDPYLEHCKETVELVTEKCHLPPHKWGLSFQSRFGKSKWIKPYTDETLVNLAKNNIKNICVICPGFSSDCLETLEEINIRYRAVFLNAGGENFELMSCLNDQDNHILMMAKIILMEIKKWGG